MMLYIVPLLLSAVLSLIVMLYVRRSPAEGARAFGVAQYATIGWSVGYAIQILADIEDKRFWIVVTNLAIVAIAPVWLEFTIAYAGLWERVRKYRWVIWADPIISSILILTHTHHSVYWTEIAFHTLSPGYILGYMTTGPVFWVHVTIAYTTILTGLAILGGVFFKSPGLYRGQITATIVGLLFPPVTNVLHLAGIDPIPRFDLTPVTFTLLFATIGFGLFRYRFLDISPFATDAILEHVGESVIVLDNQDRLVFINHSALEVLPDVSPADIGKPAAETLPSLFDQIGTSEDSAQTEVVLDVGDSQKTFTLQLTPITDKRDRIAVKLIVLHDISERKAMEEALVEGERRLRQTVNAVTDIIFAIDLEGNFTFANRAGARMIGLTVSQALEMNIEEIVVLESDLVYLKSEMAKAASGERVLGRYEYPIKGRRGGERMLEVTLTTQRDSRRRVIGFFGVGRDVTERKKVEQELITAKEDAEAANVAKSTFLANMSHEFRTPLNAILGYTQLLSNDEELSEGNRRAIRTIEDSGQHLLELINEVLDLSKIKAGRESLNVVTFDLNALMRTISGMFEVRCEQKDLKWILEAETLENAKVEGDEAKLRQILINLLGNAVKFCDRGSVTCRMSRDGDNYSFVVIDTGPGMTQEEQQAIFEPFRQETVGRQHGGTGLGLAIAKQHVEMMGGTLRVSSSTQTGSEFYFTVHLSPSTEEVVSTVPERQWSDARLKAGQKVRAFVVDDVPTNRDLLTRMLERSGIDVDIATNGREALENVKDDHDIIFMDIRMPEMSGTEALRRLHEAYGRDRYKIVAVTASAFDHQRRAFLEMGFDGFIDKPVSLEGVLSTTADLLNLEFEFSSASVSSVAGSQADWSELSIPETTHEGLQAAVDEFSITDLRRHIDTLSELGDRERTLAEHLRTLSASYDMDAIREVVSGLAVAEGS